MAIEIKNGTIMYIEPNDLQDARYDNIPFKTEDLCIAVDIEVEIPSRYKEATGNGDNHMWINDTKQTISFLGGTDGMLTTSFTDISGYHSKGGGNKETLGIKSIKIEYNSYYFPTVNVVFTDVRGSSLMEAQEEGYVDSLVNKDKIMSQGSFFRALFKFPYPVFHMKIKGFYGKPVEYDLVVSKFNTSFDSNTGNFDVEVEFIGHMYGVYGDLPFKYIMYAPYVKYPDTAGNSYWNDQVEAGVYRFDDGKKMIPFFELKDRIQRAQSNRTNGLEGTVKQYRLELREIDDIKDVLASFDTLVNSFGGLKYQNKHLPGEKEGRYILILEKNSNGTAKRNITAYEQFCTKLENYKTTWNRTTLPKFDKNLSWSRSICYTIQSTSEESFNYDLIKLNKDNNPVIKNNVDIIKEFGEDKNKSIIRDIFSNLRTQLWDDAVVHSGASTTAVQYYSEIEGYFFDTQNFLSQIKGIMETISLNSVATKKKLIEAEYQNLIDIIGFAPTAKNIVKLLFAHIDCFMHKVHSCLDLINNPRTGRKRTFNTIGFNVTNTDVRHNVGANTFVPPFPLTINDRNETVYPAVLPNIKADEMPELDLIESILTTIQNRSRDLETSSEKNFIKNLMSDVFIGGNVYKGIDGGSPNPWGDIIVTYANRLFNKFALETAPNEDEALKNFAYTEAFNVFQNIETDKALLDSINFGTNEVISYLTGAQLDKFGEDNNAYLSEKNPRFMYNTTDTKNYTYDWMVKDRSHHRNSVLLTDYKNILEAKSIYTNDKIEDRDKLYPLSNDITELFEDYQCVFDVRADFGAVAMKSESADRMESMKKYFNGNSNEYDIIESNRNKIFTNIVSINDVENPTKNLTGSFNKWFTNTFNVTQQSASPQSYLEYLSQSLSVDNNFKSLLFDGDNLFKNEFYRIQGVEGRALLFLETLPFSKEEVLNKLPYENKIIELPYFIVLFMGGVLYYLNQGFCFNNLDGKYKIPSIPLFAIDVNESLGLIQATETDKNYICGDNDLSAKLLGLKWPVQHKLMSIFIAFVKNDFIGIDNRLSIGISAGDYSDFEMLIKNLLAYKQQVQSNNNADDYLNRTPNSDVCVMKYSYTQQEKDTDGNWVDVDKEGEEYFLYYQTNGKNIDDINQDAWSYIKEQSIKTGVTKDEYEAWKNTLVCNGLKIFPFSRATEFNNYITNWAKDSGNTMPTSQIIKCIYAGYNEHVVLSRKNNEIDWGYDDKIGFSLYILTQRSWVYMLGKSHMDSNNPIRKYYIYNSTTNKLLEAGNIGDAYSVVKYIMNEADRNNKVYGPWGKYIIDDGEEVIGRDSNLQIIRDDRSVGFNTENIKITSPGWIKYNDGKNSGLLYAYKKSDKLSIVFPERFTNESYADNTNNAIFASVYGSKLTPDKRETILSEIANSLFITQESDLSNVFQLSATSETQFSYDKEIVHNRLEQIISPMIVDISSTRIARAQYMEAQELLDSIDENNMNISATTYHIGNETNPRKKQILEAQLKELLEEQRNIQSKISNHPYISGNTINEEKIQEERRRKLEKQGQEYSIFGESLISGTPLNPYTEEYTETNGFIVQSIEHSYVADSGSTDQPQLNLTLSQRIVENGITYFINALTKYKSYVVNNRVRGTFSNDILESTYLLVKSLYDRWLCGIPGGAAFWSLDKKVNKGRGEYERFKFIDSYYNDISDELFVNLNELKAELDRCSTTGDYSPSVYVFLANVNEKCKCLLIPSPAFGATTTLKDYEDLFRPLPYSVMASTRGSGPAYLWIYPGNPSTVYDGDSEYEPDSFDIADSTGRSFAPTMPEKLFDNTLEGVTIPAFGVSIGAQNQGFVKNVSLSTTKFEQTEYSIKNSIAIADTYGKQPQAVNYLSQDLYRVYANYSYTVTVELMGNVCISPMMYFQLNNVPMFKGAYYVVKVSHNIGPGTMTTSITGVRISKNKVPIMREVLSLSNVSDVELANASEVLTEAKEYIPMSLFKLKSVYRSSLPADKMEYSIENDLGKMEKRGDYETAIINIIQRDNFKYQMNIVSGKDGINTGITQAIIKNLYEIGWVAKAVGYNVTLNSSNFDEITKFLTLRLSADANDGYKTPCNNELYDMICCLYCDSDDYISNIGFCQDGVRLVYNLQPDKNGKIPVTRKKYYGLYDDKQGIPTEFYKKEWLRDADGYANTINDYIRKAPTYVGTMAYLAKENRNGSINSTLFNFARIEGKEKMGMIELLIEEHVNDILR